MTDKIIILDKDGQPRWIVEGDDVRPHPDHVHVFGWFGRHCKICKKSKTQILEEIT